MIAMLDTSEELAVCEAEIGCPVEQLLTPGTRFNLQREDAMFGIDNFAYSGFKAEPFLSLLEREKSNRGRCRFVCAPDVVGSAIRTLECYGDWRHKLAGWPVALVAQDGQESHAIPWHSITAIFIGGSTEWKMSKWVVHIIRAAQIMGKWVHVGRVNTPGRFEYFESLGADSIDGSGLARYSWMRERIYKAQNNPRLFTEETDACVH
jgi:hypothetical protein